MCLRFVFLLITRVAAWLRLSRRGKAWKTAEILVPPHQLALLQRRQPGRPKLNWADRALLATLLGLIPKARRQGLRLLVTPDTIVRWHRDIVRRRWAARSMRGRTGRPTTRRNIQGPGPTAGPREPQLGIPKDPRRTGRTRHKGRSVHRVGDPQGQRHQPRPAADRADLVAIPALPGRGHPGAAFFTGDLLGGTQAYVLAVIEHATRRIRILGITLHPTREWTTQQARNLIMDLGEQADQVKFMIRYRGSNFTTAFDAVLADAGIRTVLCNIQTPRMNAIAERWTGDAAASSWTAPLSGIRPTCGGSCAKYETHHNQHRPHRSLYCAAPLKPLPVPVDLDLHRIRRRAQV